MKCPKLLFLILFFVATEASAQLKAGTIVARTKEKEKSDSIVFYETNIGSRQSSHLNLLTGTWNVLVMRKQARMDPDQLNTITLTLNPDSTFTGQASCNKFWGKFSLKGTSIKFNNITSTKMTCDKQEEENSLLRLLQNTVSNYTVTSSKLLLRDGSSNVVFEAGKK
jgi:heat shock protein HslJ